MKKIKSENKNHNNNNSCRDSISSLQAVKRKNGEKKEKEPFESVFHLSQAFVFEMRCAPPSFKYLANLFTM